MAGLKIFRSLRDALDEGWQVYDRTHNGYIVRMRGERGWMLGIVDCTGNTEELPQEPAC